MIKLGSNTFEVPPPKGMQSFGLLQRVLPVAGRLMGVLLSLVGEDPSLDAEKLLGMDLLRLLPLAVPGFGRIFAEMPAGEFELLTRALLADTKCDGLPLFGTPGGDAYDTLLRGRTIDSFKLLWEAIRVWYPDVFTLALALNVAAPAAKGSQVSPTSLATGPATG